QDPIGLDGGLNLYMYPLNSVTNIDPLGLSIVAPRLTNQDMPALFKDMMQSMISSCESKSSGYSLTCQTAYDSDCEEIHMQCEILCRTAKLDPDMMHVWGGSLFSCLNGCIPARCGGNAV
ncbi:hypothetical protein ERL64_21640, partial [Hafnia alvei]